MVNGVHHLFDREVGADEGLTALSEGGAELWVAREEKDSLGSSVVVALFDEEAGLTVEADFICAVEVVGDDGFSGGEGLGQGAG